MLRRALARRSASRARNIPPPSCRSPSATKAAPFARPRLDAHAALLHRVAGRDLWLQAVEIIGGFCAWLAAVKIARLSFFRT